MSYSWEEARQVFTLDDASNPANARLSRSRLPTPATAQAVESERAMRQGNVARLATALENQGTSLMALTSQLATARDRLLNAHGFRWRDGPHLFEIVVSKPDAVPFPAPVDVDAVRRKRLVACDEPHCSVFGEFFDSTQEELDSVVRAFEMLRIDVRNLENQVDYLTGTVIPAHRSQLAAAEKTLRSPIRISASLFPHSTAPSVLNPATNSQPGGHFSSRHHPVAHRREHHSP